MPLTIQWRGSKADLIRRLYQLAPIFAGGAPDPSNVMHGLLLACGVTLLGKVQEAYDIKSQGGTDAMGIHWAPLAAATLALRNKVTTAKAIAKLKAQFASLPQSRKNQINEHYSRLFDLYTAGNGSGAIARGHARSLLTRMQAFIAPTRYKRLHAELSAPLKQDKAQKLAQAGAVALILRDTGRMFNSLSPRIDSPDRIIRVRPGSVSVGSNVSQFKYHQSRLPRKLKADGTPRLPRRQILPDDQTPVPVEWCRAIADTIMDAMRERAFWQQFLGSHAVVA